MWQWLIDKGWAATETAATRIEVLFMLAFFPAVYYFMKKYNYWGAGAALMFIGLGSFKTWAGYKWLKFPNNPYGWVDYLTFKPGRRTPERLFGKVGMERFGKVVLPYDMYNAPDNLDKFHKDLQQDYKNYTDTGAWESS